MADDPRRQAFLPYIAYLADAMRLRDWEFLVSNGPPGGEDDLASVACIWGRRTATIRLSEAFLADSDAEQRHTLVHELCHCPFGPMHNLIDVEHANGTVNDSTYRAFGMLYEHGVDHMAEVISRLVKTPAEFLSGNEVRP